MATTKKQTAKKVHEAEVPKSKSQRCVLVGTYKREPDQLKWIGKRHLYNYPLSAEEAQTKNCAWDKVKELWLYSGTKDRRHIYAAEFIGIKLHKDFLAEHPDYPKGKGKGHGDFYAVFSVRHKYQPTIDDSVVTVRVKDFTKRTPKIAKAIKAYQSGGELGCLLDYLPVELAPLTHDQLRVCEAAIKCALTQRRSTFEHPVIANVLRDKRWRGISLFAGAGGCSLGAKNAGVEIIGAYEIADAAIATYIKNFGAGSCCKEDLSTCDFISLRNRLGLQRGDLDLIIGGPPCQGFTTAGSRRSGDPRNMLVENYFNALDAFYPRWFMLENVEGILTTANGRFIIECIRAAARIGYTLFLKKVYMQEYGIPQRRKRVLLVGNREGKEFNFPSPQHVAFGGIFRYGSTTLRDAIGDIENYDIPEISHVRQKETGLRFERIHALKEGQTMRDLPVWLQHESYGRRAARRVCDGTPSEKRGGAPVGLKRLIYDEPSLTITSAAASEFVHPIQDRMLTVRECARIQSFPDDFLFCGTFAQQMLQIGNAIPPYFAEQLVNQMYMADASQVGVHGSGLIRFEVTKAKAQSPALEKTCGALRDLMPGHLTQMTMEL